MDGKVPGQLTRRLDSSHSSSSNSSPLLSSFRTKVLRQMGDRECEIVLLDGTSRRMKIQPSLLGQELFDLIASQFGLHEKDFFGLNYIHEETGLHFWLDRKVKVLEQVPKNKKLLKLQFGVQYYVEDVVVLRELTTQRLFFQQAMMLIKEGQIGCSEREVITLAALALQATDGDYLSESATRHHIDAMKLIPDKFLLDTGTSLEKCAELVAAEYKSLMGMDQPSAILSYMAIVQALPQYSVHYYDVKDAKGVPWRLGVCPSGINLYYFSDTVEPRLTYRWSQLANVSFSKTKFTMDIENTDDMQRARSATMDSTTSRGPGRKMSIIDRLSRGASSPANDPSLAGMIHSTWYTPSPHHSKMLLTMVINQHSFYLKHRKTRIRDQQIQRSPNPAQRRRSLGLAAGDTSSPRNANNRLETPGARFVNLPSGATGLQRVLLARGTTGGTGSSSSFSETVGSASPAPMVKVFARDSITESSDSEANLDRLVRRRKQVLAELERKKKLLDKLSREERDYLTVVQGHAPTIEEMKQLSESIESLHRTDSQMQGVSGKVDRLQSESYDLKDMASADPTPRSSASSSEGEEQDRRSSASSLSSSGSDGDGQGEEGEEHGDDTEAEVFIPEEHLVSIAQTIILEEPEEDEEEEEEEEEVEGDTQQEKHARGSDGQNATSDGSKKKKPGLLETLSIRNRSGVSVTSGVSITLSAPESESGGVTTISLHGSQLDTDAESLKGSQLDTQSIVSPMRSRSNSAVALALAMLDDRKSLSGEPIDDEERTAENEFGLRTPIVSLRSVRSRPSISTAV